MIRGPVEELLQTARLVNLNYPNELLGAHIMDRRTLSAISESDR